MHWKIKFPAHAPAGDGGAAKPGEEQKPAAEGEQKPGEQKPGEQKPAIEEVKKGAEGQPDDKGKKPGEEKPGDAGAKKAPEKYVLAVPDDAKRFVAAEDLTFIEQIARENDWTQDEAQAELEAHLTRAQARVKVTVDAWEAETKADTTYGGDKLSETQQLTKRAIDALRPEGHARRDSFLAFMKNSGGGVNLEVVSFLADLGRMMGEDNPALGRSANLRQATQDDADKFYDHPSSIKLREGSKG